MKDNPSDPGWPIEAGELDALPTEIEPPPEIEGRVTRALRVRGLLRPSDVFLRRRTLSSFTAVAASLAVFALGFFVGRAASPRAAEDVQASASPVQARFALLLYETEAYERPDGGEELELYDDYSRWVADARNRRQFVTGEDLATEDGFLLSPGVEQLAVVRNPEAVPGSTLSGMFVVTARDYEDAISLAEKLPHLRRGGHVVVQRVLPTEEPPEIDLSRD